MSVKIWITFLTLTTVECVGKARFTTLVDPGNIQAHSSGLIAPKPRLRMLCLKRLISLILRRWPGAPDQDLKCTEMTLHGLSIRVVVDSTFLEASFWLAKQTISFAWTWKLWNLSNSISAQVDLHQQLVNNRWIAWELSTQSQVLLKLTLIDLCLLQARVWLIAKLTAVYTCSVVRIPMLKQWMTFGVTLLEWNSGKEWILKALFLSQGLVTLSFVLKKVWLCLVVLLRLPRNVMILTNMTCFKTPGKF